MKLSELKGRPVVSLADAQNVGNVGEVLVDRSYLQIQALTVLSKRRDAGLVVSFGAVRGIGPDAITIEDQKSLRAPSQVPEYDTFVRLGDLLHKNVLSEDGQVLGSISEIHFDAHSGRIDRFEYNGKPLAGLLGHVPDSVDATDLVGVGPRSVTVRKREKPTKAA